jgi:hypothetical protein
MQWQRLPESARDADPRSVDAVAAAPWSGHAVAAVPRSGVVAAVPRSVEAAHHPEGERRRAPVRASGGVPGAPRRRHSEGGWASGAPRRASSDGAAGGARFERRHGRREVHISTIVRGILRSGIVRAARVTTSICACVVDDVLRQLPPPIRVVFRLLCFMPITCTIYAKNCTILCLNMEFVYQFTAYIFFACTLERQFVDLCYL